MKKIWMFLSLCLLACAQTPAKIASPLRLQAEQANRAAVEYAKRQQWSESLDAWKEALRAYQSMDDWAGQGRARLGLAAALDAEGQKAAAVNVLERMPALPAYSAAQRAQAAYQLALLAWPDADAVTKRLLMARQQCAKPCGLTARMDNLAAGLAAQKGDWAEVERLARAADKSAAHEPTTRAHAQRLLAEAALARQNPAQAKTHLESALQLDRELAVSQWLLDDYRLLLKIAQALQDKGLEQEALLRQQSLCEGLGAVICGKP